MIGPAAGTHIWIVAGETDMRRGLVGLGGMVQEGPGGESVFRSGVRVSWEAWGSDQGSLVGWRRAVLVREAAGARAIIWPQATSGTVSLTPAQLSMLLEGIDWRRPVRSYAPQMAV
jgi:transposase